MLGKKIIANPKQLFVNGKPITNLAIYLFSLLVMIVFVAMLMSYALKSFGESATYQKLFSGAPDHELQRQLFVLRKNNADSINKNLLVGSPEFIDALLSSQEMSQCRDKVDAIRIPNYSLKNIVFRAKSKEVTNYHNLSYKNVLFENNASIWSEFATEPQKHNLKIWKAVQKQKSLRLNRHNIKLAFASVKLFFETSSDALQILLGRENAFEFKKKSDIDYVYSFHADKLDRLKVPRDGADLNLIFNGKKPKYMKKVDYEKFKTFFEKNDHEINIKNFESLPLVKRFLGC